VTGVRTARFVYVRDGKVQHEDVVFSGNTVAVPILSGIDSVKIGVFAGELRTTTPAVVRCGASILCGSGEVHEPTPDVYDQIMALFNDLAERGGFGATEAQAQQIAQNQADIAALVSGTKKAGKAASADQAANATNAENANTLGGQAPSYYGKSSEVTAGDGSTRGQDTDISDYRYKMVFVGLKEGNAINLPVCSYSYVFGLQGWSDQSGGLAHELAFNDMGIYRRRVYDDNTKTNWVKVSDSDDLANYLPKSGGAITAKSYIPLVLASTDYGNALLQFIGKDGTLGYIGFEGADELKFLNSSGGLSYNILHTGNMVDHVLPKTGGTLGDGASSIPLTIDGGESMAFVEFRNVSKNRYGGLGFIGENSPAFIKADRSAAISLHHDGNSAKVHIGTSAPSDTSALWIDTSA